ncbi:ShlB/FhaC/HecB family hemolysin secretion/activation protein [Pseudomonas lopnurensis]|uniref:ShlB/FhaC/HecB family hemolysin secretion/activation protein n=1 Tax=Pseudomonas lopnurensis TaxID=1477517 RepID=UPI001879A8B6|nr:ShlB/FhaC/HecB family hemolysin secretion/activation protein [Pseudomonas lopnurensis]MBE7374943.1 ShlB/FhaC/HecB family hemolysin secretion/activation protein [Pseudomonas lopnurensis]
MRFTLCLLALALTSAPLDLLAAPESPPPDAGQSLRGLDQRPLQLPTPQPLDLNLPDAPGAEVQAGGPTLQVSGFALEGNTALANAELLALLDDLKGRTVSLGELQAGANRITRLYRERGYPLARAYLPAQEIEHGVVRIAVLEGRYGAIEVDDQADLWGSALAPLAALRSGDVLKAGPLEHSLLLLKDTPGVEVAATLKPGASVGTTDLRVDVRPDPLLSGSIDADNYGNRFTGEYRLGGTLNLNNPLGLGDRVSLRAMGSDEDQHYYRAAYQLPLGPWATQVGVAYSDMDYQLAKDFGDLDAHGNARIASIFLAQPLVRRRDFYLDAHLQFDGKHLKDDIDLFASRSDKRSRQITASLSASGRDVLLGGGLSSASLSLSHGSLNIDGELERLLDDLSAGSAGQFNVLRPTFTRLQRLNDRFSFYGQVQGQWADGNLDSSEKLYLGGAHGVRAYPQGEASGDQGWLANLELRYALTPAWQLSTFVDHGQVRRNKAPWDDGDNHRSLSGAGLGATWAAYGWQITATAAWKLGNSDAESDVERTPRVWGQLVRYF